MDTGSDQYAVVISGHVMDGDEARELYLADFEDEEDREAMRVYWAGRGG